MDPAVGQGHFIREFKAFIGITPMAYDQLPRRIMRSAGTERVRTAGARVQGLHRPG